MNICILQYISKQVTHEMLVLFFPSIECFTLIQLYFYQFDYVSKSK